MGTAGTKLSNSASPSPLGGLGGGWEGRPGWGLAVLCFCWSLNPTVQDPEILRFRNSFRFVFLSWAQLCSRCQLESIFKKCQDWIIKMAENEEPWRGWFTLDVPCLCWCVCAPAFPCSAREGVSHACQGPAASLHPPCFRAPVFLPQQTRWLG